MARTCAAGIIVKDGNILLMHRINNGKEYYSFPGGGQEDGETLEQAVVRELMEETTVSVEPEKLLYDLTWYDGGHSYYYLSKYISGEPMLDPNSEEAHEMKGGKQFYKPLWIPVADLPSFTLYPLTIRDALIKDLQNNFSDTSVKKFTLDKKD